jgi:hypothetical protein
MCPLRGFGRHERLEERAEARSLRGRDEGEQRTRVGVGSVRSFGALGGLIAGAFCVLVAARTTGDRRRCARVVTSGALTEVEEGGALDVVLFRDHAYVQAWSAGC